MYAYCPRCKSVQLICWDGPKREFLCENCLLDFCGDEFFRCDECREWFDNNSANVRLVDGKELCDVCYDHYQIRRTEHSLNRWLDLSR